MKSLFYGGWIFSFFVLCGGVLYAQTDAVKEVRLYDYSDEIIGASNQLYRMVVAGENGRLATWKDILVTNTKPATAISLSPSGSNFAVANSKFLIEIWSLETRNVLLGKLKGHSDAICALDYSRDTRYLVSGSLDKTVKIWDVKSGLLFKNLPCKYPVHSVCFSPNGYFIACDQGNDIVVFNFMKSVAVQGLNGGHRLPIVKMKFSDDGKYLMSLDEGGVVNVWRVSDGEVCQKLAVTGGVKDADMHHNNKYLATIDEEGKLKMWNLKKKELMQTLKSKQAGKTVHFSYDYDKEEALLTHCDRKNCYIWDIVRLEPAFDVLAAKMQEERMNLWNRKRVDESSEAYAKRVNDSLQVKSGKVMSEVLTELGLKWRPLGKPQRSEYDKEQKGYVLIFPNIKPFVLKMTQEEGVAFEEAFDRCEFNYPIYSLDERDDFGLVYLEVYDPVKKKVCYLDDQRRHVQPQKKMVSGEIVKKIGEEEVVLKQKLKDYFDREMAQQRISDNV
ncbi:MAG: hypothetical protein RSA53_12040, partial [Odoribacter sp.]